MSRSRDDSYDYGFGEPETYLPYGMEDPLYGEIDGTEEDHPLTFRAILATARETEEFYKDVYRYLVRSYRLKTESVWNVDDPKDTHLWYTLFYVWVQRDKAFRYTLRHQSSIRKD